MPGAGGIPLGRRFLLIALLAVALPLGLTGAWLVRDAGRAGESLLRTRMAAAVDELARETGSRWVQLRSRILDLADDPRLQAALAMSAVGEEEGRASLASDLSSAHPSLADILRMAAITDPRGVELARLEWDSGASGGRDAPGLPASVEIRRRGSGERLGRLDVLLLPEALLSGWAEIAARTGGVVGVLDARDGRPLVSVPFDPGLLLEDRFFLGAETWITDRRQLAEPPLELVLASPLEPFTLPFREAARRGIALIMLVGVGGFLTASFLTVQTTRSVARLASAAEAVASGDLETRVRPRGPQEVARAARAFNAMAASLGATLDTLSKREALAAVGEFAAALAHELRNPLTAIRLDLQRIDEVSDDEERRAALIDRMLAAARQLDRTVEGVLRMAGTGVARRAPVSLDEPLRRAARTARSTFETRAAALVLPELDAWPVVTADSPALEQLFLNLLVNAAEALEPGGSVAVDVRCEPTHVTVVIADTGPGIPDEVRDRIFEPLFTTKPRGTGLGLAIAERIARAHGGRLELGDGPGGGTQARVRLPIAEWPGPGRECDT